MTLLVLLVYFAGAFITANIDYASSLRRRPGSTQDMVDAAMAGALWPLFAVVWLAIVVSVSVAMLLTLPARLIGYWRSRE